MNSGMSDFADVQRNHHQFCATDLLLGRVDITLKLQIAVGLRQLAENQNA
jgi:hypothetical protein